MSSGPVDGKYYQAVAPESLAERLLLAARDNIYRDFMAQMTPSPTDLILDVGVSDVINDGANVLERNYPHRSQITACGLSDGADFQRAFPDVRYKQIEPNTVLPFDDKQFNVATANAVLEHVGSDANQLLFVREMARVARRVFISVPNRYFPVEHHTALPFVHYLDSTFRAACAVTNRTEWAKTENLILMTTARLSELAKATGRRFVVRHTGINLGPFSSNLYLAILD